jgi:hypothetical protein
LISPQDGSLLNVNFIRQPESRAMKISIPENFQSMDETSWMVILAAAAIVVIILFAKAIKTTLKLIVIAGMLAVIAYFLRQHGII